MLNDGVDDDAPPTGGTGATDELLADVVAEVELELELDEALVVIIVVAEVVEELAEVRLVVERDPMDDDATETVVMDVSAAGYVLVVWAIGTGTAIVFPPTTTLVVRAVPNAAAADSTELMEASTDATD